MAPQAENNADISMYHATVNVSIYSLHPQKVHHVLTLVCWVARGRYTTGGGGYGSGGYGSGGGSGGGGSGREAGTQHRESSTADGLRGIYARFAERHGAKLDENNAKPLFEYLKGN